MATLTEISVVARNIIKWGAVGLVVLMLIPGTWGLIRRIYQNINPPPPAPPTVKYGKLPVLFGQTDPQGLTYKLETIEGGLPALQDVAKVYLVGINKSRLLELDRLRNKARSLGFVNEPVKLDDLNYKFFHRDIPAEITFNIISNGFTYRFDWTKENTIYNNHSMPIGNQAIYEARSFLAQLGLLPDDLAGGTGTQVYLIATGSAMVPAQTIFEANFTRVDLFRADKDKLKVVATGGDTSPVNVIFSGLGANKRVVQANYQYSMILDDDSSTYPLKPVSLAWQELQEGKGFIAKRAGAGAEIVIRKVSLAYYESNSPQEFFQPVYVFEGDGGFIGYVQAVRSDYTQTTAATETPNQ